MHNQSLLNNYFTNNWCPSTSKYIYSGYAIAKNIKANEKVIDIGCGTNPFKGHINLLIGIDPTDVGCDVLTTIEDFNTKYKFDVALCLGSINFGDINTISEQIYKINSLLNPTARVYWRLNPGQNDHKSSLSNKIDFFNWDFNTLNTFAVKYNFKQVNCAYDTNSEHLRLYAEWVR